MLQNVRFALRLFVHRRGFFATTVLTIALGVGLSSTVFAVVDGILFRPLPYREAGRLVAVYGAVRAEGEVTMSVSVPDLTDWRAASRTFERLEGYDVGGPQAQIRNGDVAIQVVSGRITPGFLDMLGVQPTTGRTFVADDFKPGAPSVAIITDRIWRGAFGSDPNILGRSVGLGANQHTIVGVLPGSFVFPIPPRRFSPEVLVPFASAAVANDRTARFLYLIGRLLPGASLQQARTEMDAIALRLKPLYVGRPNLHPGAFDGTTLMDLRDQLTLASRGVLRLVFAAVATVFLISCVNVVGLLIAHNEDRTRELAVRSAIGAGRSALVRQLLVEAGVLATAGASAGWLVSTFAFGALLRQIPERLQLLGEPRLGARAAAFAAILAVLTLVVAGLVPALRASGGAPREALGAGTRTASGSRRRRHALIFVEVALATVLVCAGSLMLRGWIRLHSQDSGMDDDRVVAVRAVPPGITDAAARARHNAAIVEAVRRVPGVEAVALIDIPLLQNAMRGSKFIPPAKVPGPAGVDTDVTVTPNYFSTMGVAIRMGRALVGADRGRGIVISETMARRYWPGRNPVGETIRYGDETRDIVGVAADTRDVAFDRVPTATLYHAWDDRQAATATIVARFAGPSDRVLTATRRAVRTAVPDAVISMLATVDDLLSASVAPRNFNTLLFGVFAAAGLTVAIVGIYGLVAFVVARREREMGIRLALGANGRGLQIFVMSATLRWVAAGLAAGMSAALLCAQYLRPFVYQIPANDPATLAIAAVTFLAVAALATYIPARRAARVDPMIALRAE